MYKVIRVKPYPDFSLEIHFADGLVKRFDMRQFIDKGISEPLGNWDYFNQVTIEEGGGITWPNGYDFCPEFLHDNVPVARPAVATA